MVVHLAMPHWRARAQAAEGWWQKHAMYPVIAGIDGMFRARVGWKREMKG